MTPPPAIAPETLAAASVDDLIGLLIEHEDRVDRALFDACVARGDAMIAALADYFRRADAEGEAMDDYSWWMEVHGFLLAGAIPSEAAGQLLLERLIQAGREDDYTLDWVSGDMPHLFANKPAGIIEAARHLAENREAAWHPRTEAAEVVIGHAHATGPEALDEALDWLARQVANPDDDENFRFLAGNLLLDFPRERHRALLETLAREQEESEQLSLIFVAEDIRAAFARGTDKPHWLRRGDPRRFYDDNQIQTRQKRWQEEAARAERRGMPDTEAWTLPVMPYVRELPKPGRNDPCPCGSGKKYKKCCMAADEAREAALRAAH